MKKQTIVFAPHFDDETLGCGGTIAKKLSEGCNVFIVFMTDGRHALTELGVFSEPTPIELKEIRRKEAVRATKILGLQEERLLFLDVEDKTLQKHQRETQERIVEILKKISPAEIYYPQEKEVNVDHRMTNRLVRSSIVESSIHPFEYQYAIGWSYPFNLMVLVGPEHVFDFFASKFLKRRIIHQDISCFLHLKKKALNEYKSQITVLSSQQKRPIVPRSYLRRLLRNEEKFFVNSSVKIQNN